MDTPDHRKGIAAAAVMSGACLVLCLLLAGWSTPAYAQEELVVASNCQKGVKGTGDRSEAKARSKSSRGEERMQKARKRREERRDHRRARDR